MKRTQKGFTLIELLIVVAIILIIAAIAIPSLIKSRMTANEASAVGSLHLIMNAQAQYASLFPNTGFAGTLAALGGASGCSVGTVAASCLINDANLTAGTKAGYTFAIPAITPGTDGLNDTYQVTAVPVTVGVTGGRGFSLTQNGVITYTLNGAVPSASSSALQ